MQTKRKKRPETQGLLLKGPLRFLDEDASLRLNSQGTFFPVYVFATWTAAALLCSGRKVMKVIRTAVASVFNDSRTKSKESCTALL